jgi:hypothetical protein
MQLAFMNLNIPHDLLKKMAIATNPSFLKTKPLSHWLSGEAAFNALQQAVDELVQSAPKNHDVLIEAFGIFVREVKYINPHTFIFCGNDDQGHETSVVCHFSQLVARVVYLPKRGKSRVITGFSPV